MKYYRMIHYYVNPVLKTKRRISAIYFLLMRDELLYIGSTRNLKCRLSLHKSYGPIQPTHFRFIECEGQIAKDNERRWIKKFKPRLNQILYDGTESRRHSNGYDPNTFQPVTIKVDERKKTITRPDKPRNWVKNATFWQG